MKKIAFIQILVLAAFWPLQAQAGVKKIAAGIAVYEIKKHGPEIAAKYAAHKAKKIAAQKMADNSVGQIIKDEVKDYGNDRALDMAKSAADSK